MAELTVNTVNEDGLALTFTAVSASDTFLNSGKELAVIKNESGGNLTVTVVSQISTGKQISPYGNVEKPDVTLLVADGTTSVFGPFPRGGFNNSSNLVELQFSTTTTVTASIIKPQ